MSGLKIITEPSVYLVGRQTIDDAGLGQFLTDHDVSTWTTDTDVAGEKLVEVAGRLCYLSFAKPRPGGNRAYIDHILGVAHGSVTEHAVWNLIFTGISRSLSHELVRHRVGMSPSQLSQRYVDESDCAFVVPHEIAKDDLLMATWKLSVNTALATYKYLTDALSEKLAGTCSQCGGPAQYESIPATCVCGGKALHGTELRKAARQAARSVLPNATETKIFVTANARALRHFIELRASRHADVEIRKLACKVWEVMAVESPHLFGDYVKTPLPDGTYELTTEHKKV